MNIALHFLYSIHKSIFPRSFSSLNIAQKTEWKVHHDCFHSDHFPIIIDTDVVSENFQTEPKFCFKKANWHGYRNTLIIPEISACPDQTCSELEQAILNSAQQNIPQTKPYDASKCKNFWNEECSKVYKDKNRAFNKYKKDRGNIDLWIEYKKCKAIFKHTLLKAKKQSWEVFVSSINSQTPTSKVWKKTIKTN